MSLYVVVVYYHFTFNSKTYGQLNIFANSKRYYIRITIVTILLRFEMVRDKSEKFGSALSHSVDQLNRMNIRCDFIS